MPGMPVKIDILPLPVNLEGGKVNNTGLAATSKSNPAQFTILVRRDQDHRSAHATRRKNQ